MFLSSHYVNICDFPLQYLVSHGGLCQSEYDMTDIIFGVVYPAHDSSVFVGKTQNWYGLK